MVWIPDRRVFGRLSDRPAGGQFVDARNQRPALSGCRRFAGVRVFGGIQPDWRSVDHDAGPGISRIGVHRTGRGLDDHVCGHIPQEASARFFGFLSVVLLLPNTVVPPLWPVLEKTFGGFNNVLLFFAGMLILIIPLVGFIDRKKTAPDATRSAGKLSRSDIWRNLADTRIILMLSAMLLFYCGHALVFFFLAGFAAKIGIAGVGFFFTLTTVGEIGVRLTVGNYFDRANKIVLAVLTMIGLAIGYGLLGMTHHEYLFFALGAYLGLGWGVAMPVFNGLMFDLSKPELRAFNSNLGLQMFQAGFFVGPFIGGFVVPHLGFPALFQLCALLSLMSAALSFVLGRRVKG
jgi:hypothetical protein